MSQFSTPQWIAGIYLGVAGGALAFILWVLALERASPTRVANTMTVNPLAAGLLATQLVGEPITPNLVLGLDRGVRRDLDRNVGGQEALKATLNRGMADEFRRTAMQ